MTNQTKKSAYARILISGIICAAILGAGSGYVLAQTEESPEPGLLNLRDSQAMASKTAFAAKLSTSGTLSSILAIFVQSVLGLIGMVFMILIIYGGFLWMTAAGIEDKITKAKKLILASVIGLAIVMAAFGIATFIINALGIQ